MVMAVEDFGLAIGSLNETRKIVLPYLWFGKSAERTADNA